VTIKIRETFLAFGAPSFGPGETDALAGALRLLAGDAPRRTEMGAAAERYAEGELDVEQVAELYRRAIVEVAGGGAVRSQVVSEVAVEAQGSGFQANAAELNLIAGRLREVGI
jgi:hypothetical protein